MSRPNAPRDLPRRPSRTALRRELRRAARNFADELVELLASHGVWNDGRDPNDEPGTARVRRSTTALEDVAARVLGVLRAQHQPVAISTIAVALGMPPRKIAHPLTLLVAAGTVRRSGERRGARYRATAAKRAPRGASGQAKPAPKRSTDRAKSSAGGGRRVARKAARGAPGRGKPAATGTAGRSKRSATAGRSRAGRGGQKIPKRKR